MNNIEINDMHWAILDIAKCFHQICEINKIPYYMLGGTMLGAIRHKGFIPWDDDMDFGIPRTYINLFIKICKRNLPWYYKLVCSEDYEYQINYDTIKLIDIRYSIKEVGRETLNVNMGLFIDIFPLDESNDSWSRFSRNAIILSLLRWNSLKYIPLKNNSHPKQKIIAYLVKLLPNDFCKNLAHSILLKKGSHYSNYGGFWHAKETISKKTFGAPLLYEFEDTYFYGVQDSNSYLTSLYGDYMKLPPENKRHLHIYQCKRIQ